MIYAYASKYCNFDINNIDDEIQGKLIYSNHAPDYEYIPSDWTFVGTAEVNINYISKAEYTKRKVENLEREIKEIYADSECRVTNIRREIQELLSITHDFTQI